MFWAVGAAFLGGAGAAPFLIPQFSWPLAWLAAGTTMGTLLARGRWERLLAWTVAAAAIGLLCASLRIISLPELPTEAVTVRGTVAETVSESPTVRLESVVVEGAAWRGRLEARVRLSPLPKVGDVLELTGRISRPAELPYGWRARGIVGRMSFPGAQRVGHRASPLSFFRASHERVNVVIREGLPDPEAGFLSGILLGDRARLSEELKEALNRTGTTHLIAVSGFNVAVVIAFIWLLRGWVPYRLLLALSGAAVLGFVLLVGLSSSVVRAAIMGSLVLVAKGLGRPAVAGRLLVLAAASMAAWNPWILVDDLGFQLSFAATAGIIWLEPLLTPWLGRYLPGKLAGLFGVTLAAQLATEPLIIASFGRLSLISILVNAVVIPLIPLAMLAGALMVGAGLVWTPLASLIAWLVWPLAHGILAMIGWGSRLPGVFEELPWPQWLTALSYGLLIGLVILWRQRLSIQRGKESDGAGSNGRSRAH